MLDWSRRRALPVLHQSEAAECGLACLAMIAHYHGYRTSLNVLRHRFPISLAGANLKTIISVASELNLAGRAVRLDLDALKHLRLPALLHWSGVHFVVLKSVSRGGAVIHDPAAGVRTLSLDQLSKRFTGVAVEFTPTAEFEPAKDIRRTKLRQLWTGIRGLKRAFVQLVTLSLAIMGLSLILPLHVQLVVDQAIANGDLNFLLILTLAFGAIYIVSAAAELLRSWSVLYFGNLLTYQLVGNLFRHLIRLPGAFFEKRHVGDILSRLRSTTPIQEALTRGVIAAGLDGVLGLTLAVAMLLYSVPLTLLIFVFVILNVTITAALFPRVRALQEEWLNAQAQEQSHLMESIRASRMIRISGLESERESVWRNLYADAVNASMATGKLESVMTFLRTSLLGLQSVTILLVAGAMVIRGQMTVGMIFAFTAYAAQFSGRADAFIRQLMQFKLLGLHLDRIGDIIQTPKDVHAAGPAGLIDLKGDIELRDVSFRYGHGDAWVLRKANLTVRFGEFVAITGPSGGGKTTLLKILMGIYPPTEGEMLVDGRPMESIGKDWRGLVSGVMQDDTLLSGTIGSNIASFDPQVDNERIRKAAEAARIHDEIMRQPMNYFSLVGDMGSTLSGGQRQRVFLARALYREPKILMLDEGTANLDHASERAIADAIEAMPITRIVISHRPELIRRADRVLMLKDGVLSDATDMDLYSAGLKGPRTGAATL